MTKLDISDDQKHNKINDKALISYSILMAVFCGGLILNTTLGTKIVDIYGLYMPAGIFLWSLTFPITDIVAETYGHRYAYNFVIGGLIITLFALLMTQFALSLPSAPFWKNGEAYNTILGANMRTMVAQICSFIACQSIDIHIFFKVGEKTRGKFLWLRNNVSTFTSQAMANCIFLSIAFLGTMPFENWIALFVTNLLARIVLATIDTPMVYIGVYTIYKYHPELRDKE